MNATRRTLIAGTVSALAGPASSADSKQIVAELLHRSERGNDALMRGDIPGWSSHIPLSADFVLRSPFGGEPTRGTTPESLARMGRFFRDGTLRQEVVTTIATRDLIVLAVTEHAHVAVGGLPAQPWSLRVTLVYRREGDAWHLVLRHADPLASGLSLTEAATIAARDC